MTSKCSLCIVENGNLQKKAQDVDLEMDYRPCNLDSQIYTLHHGFRFEKHLTSTMNFYTHRIWRIRLGIQVVCSGLMQSLSDIGVARLYSRCRLRIQISDSLLYSNYQVTLDVMNIYEVTYFLGSF